MSDHNKNPNVVLFILGIAFFLLGFTISFQALIPTTQNTVEYAFLGGSLIISGSIFLNSDLSQR